MDTQLICRFCLRVCKKSFQFIGKTTQEALNVLLLNMDLDISNEPVICNSCGNNLKICFTFKKNFLNGSNYISGKDKNVVSNTTTTGTCNFCMNIFYTHSSQLLKTEDNSVRTVLNKYFAELVLKTVVDPKICIQCYSSLQNQLDFINNCLSVEAKIKNYIQIEGTSVKGQIELADVVCFMSKNDLQNYMESNVSAVKVENDYEQTEIERVVWIKKEDIAREETQDLHSINVEEIQIETEESDDKSSKKKKYGRSRLQPRFIINGRPSKTANDKFDQYIFEMKRKSALLGRTLTKKDSSKVTTKYKQNPELDLVSHIDSSSGVTIYKCKVCRYQTKYKHSILKHTHHKGPSEYKCAMCVYQSKSKSSFTRHMQIRHKDPLELKIYKCAMCVYRSKIKSNFTKHMLVHKSTAEVTMYRCEVCGLETKFKYILKRHIMLSHRSNAKK